MRLDTRHVFEMGAKRGYRFLQSNLVKHSDEEATCQQLTMGAPSVLSRSESSMMTSS